MRDWQTIPSYPYDWTITGLPERPYIHDHSKALSYKIYMAEPNAQNNASIVFINYEEALRRIKAIDKITLGAPKIVYLVGWQYFGHDSKYPAWHEMNEALKRPQDNSARDSYFWLFNEAKKYNTTVSVHINMFDAYQDSPLWDEYVQQDLIAKREDGSLSTAGIWNGMQAYIISYKREWETGYAKKRIDALCELLPLREAGTVHIDAFHATMDLGHGNDLEAIKGARRQIIRYWRDLGIDVTTEILYTEANPFGPGRESTIGLIPWYFHFAQTYDEYVTRSAYLVSGGRSHFGPKAGLGDKMSGIMGSQFDKEQALKGGNWKREIFEGFCRQDAKYLYTNSLQRIEGKINKDGVTVIFSDSVIGEVLSSKLSRKGAVFAKGSNFLMPTPWHKAGSALLYSAEGGTYDYDLTAILDHNGDTVTICVFDENGVHDPSNFYLSNGILTISLLPGEARIVYAQ